MPISRENPPQSSGNTPPPGNAPVSYPGGTRSSRPSGVAGNLPSSRPTGVSNDDTPYDSATDEMSYGRIVKIIKAIPKDTAIDV
jgi:hypothetical protein